MSNSIALVEPTVKVIVGVDTHKHVHVAVAIESHFRTNRRPSSRRCCCGATGTSTNECMSSREELFPSAPDSRPKEISANDERIVVSEDRVHRLLLQGTERRVSPVAEI